MKTKEEKEKIIKDIEEIEKRLSKLKIDVAAMSQPDPPGTGG